MGMALAKSVSEGAILTKAVSTSCFPKALIRLHFCFTEHDHSQSRFHFWFTQSLKQKALGEQAVETALAKSVLRGTIVAKAVSTFGSPNAFLKGFE